MTTDTDTTRAVVRAFLDRFAEGSAERLAELFAEPVDWQIAPNPAVPWIKPRRTRADVAAHYADIAAHTVPEHATAVVDAVVVDGAEAMVAGRLGGTVRATRRPFHSPFALRITVDGAGLISRMCVYEDSLAIADACGADVSDSFKTAGGAAA
ncbi:nuclear transport factor 2 family protein [Streptomyces litchfieldiae]|uniref:Nuclear transport factor 2 family protein n=1 Tax=Streptomyces litchfieldiae TaxID=3075543 RepID=A0ABU2MKP8_9ACTN|nr:nuclear transport factor 2 family protein [Streptomyces sp. DSM 44938]MDT0342186.1 nuclear transport factor 2 family protein [Streptomyces sp. DSM 44938]